MPDSELEFNPVDFITIGTVGPTLLGALLPDAAGPAGGARLGLRDRQGVSLQFVERRSRYH